MVLLSRALEGAEVVERHAWADVDLREVHFDSRATTPGSLFCCVAGQRADGHDHAVAAVAAGAVAVLVERPVPVEVPQVVVRSVRRAMGPAASIVAGVPSRSLAVVGVTGTNGKTTTTHLVGSIARAAGERAEVIGTLSGARTTPEGPDLQRQLAAARDAGVSVVAMEVSSHALDQHRVDGTHFAVGVFTNLGADHLDYHGTIERYFEAKARLFTPALSARGVVNLDDPWGRRLAEQAPIPVDGYRLADAEELTLDAGGSTFTWRDARVRLGLPGRFNLSNALAAASAVSAIGLPMTAIADGLARAGTVPGRFERVEGGQPFEVVVDFAHTPDALAAALDTARELIGGGQVVVVFGCGGERDQAKRPRMGEVAAQLADRVVVTSDNSRGEDTAEIMAAVRRGYDRATSRTAGDLVLEPDRRAAIATALAGASAGDLVLIAGKGHETTQTIGGTSVDFDDRVVATEILDEMGWRR